MNLIKVNTIFMAHWAHKATIKIHLRAVLDCSVKQLGRAPSSLWPSSSVWTSAAVTNDETAQDKKGQRRQIESKVHVDRCPIPLSQNKRVTCFIHAEDSWEFILPGVFCFCLISLGCSYTDSQRSWCFKTSCINTMHFSDWLIATLLLKADCRYVCFLNSDLMHFWLLPLLLWDHLSSSLGLPSLLLASLSVEKSKEIFWGCRFRKFTLQVRMMRAKVLYLVSILLKLCKKKHSNDNCPSVQREWEEFIKNKENWKRTAWKDCTQHAAAHRIILFEGFLCAALWLWSSKCFHKTER